MTLDPNEPLTHAKVLQQKLETLQEMVETGAGTGGINPSVINAKGDIVVGTADNVPGVIPAGINGQLLSSDSSTATGLKWVDAPTGGGTAPVTSVAGRTGVVTLSPADVGLANVNNTSDANKPISTATQNALNLKANTADVNTALAGKADASALAAKANLTYVDDELALKADLVDGKVPASQLPTIGSGTGVQVWEWYVDTATEGLGVMARFNDSGETLTIVAVRVRANINPPEGSDLVVDIVKNGSSSLWTSAANRPRILAGTQDTGKRTNMNITTIADGEYLVPNIISVGSIVPGSGILVAVTLR